MKFTKKELVLLEYLLGSTCNSEIIEQMENRGHKKEKCYKNLIKGKVCSHKIFIKISKELYKYK